MKIWPGKKKEIESTESERRRRVRHDVQIPAELRIIFPEETFTPIGRQAEILNVSANGMLLRMESWPTELNSKIINKIRYARINFQHPSTGAALHITGRVVWVDYRRDAQQEAAPCSLGVSFEADETHGLDTYREFVESLDTPEK